MGYDQNEGPWGTRRRKSQDSGGGNGSDESPWGRFSGGGGGEPPDFDDFMRKGQERLNRLFPGGLTGKVILIGVLIIAGIWLATGFYRVEAGQRGVELIFGRYYETTESGLQYNFPSPVGEVYLPYVDQQRRLNIGFRGDDLGRGNTQGDIAEESIMLTRDENIVDLDFTVFWKIKSPESYLFAIRDPEATVKVVAESAMREVIGQTSFDLAVTRGREEIERQSLDVMQAVLDGYNSGIDIEQIQLQASDPPGDVIDAFNDVQRARQDRDRLRNEAEAYANSIVPQARGQAERVLREAEAYKERLVEEAKGEAQRFVSVYETYAAAPEVTRRRMYLEAIGEVYGKANKIIVDPAISGTGGQGIVPYLPLNELNNARR